MIFKITDANDDTTYVAARSVHSALAAIEDVESWDETYVCPLKIEVCEPEEKVSVTYFGWEKDTPPNDVADIEEGEWDAEEKTLTAPAWAWDEVKDGESICSTRWQDG